MAPGRVIGVLAFVILSLGATVARAEAPTSLAKAFIETLSEDESQAALARFGSSDRMAIRFTPGWRGGLSLKAVDTETWLAATRLLQQTLRIEGFGRLRLFANVKQSLARSPIIPTTGIRNSIILRFSATPAQGSQ